jgi:hypothetical protein
MEGVSLEPTVVDKEAENRKGTSNLIISLAPSLVQKPVDPAAEMIA